MGTLFLSEIKYLCKNFSMDILQFLSGNGLFLILGLLLIIVVLYNKLKKRR